MRKKLVNQKRNELMGLPRQALVDRIFDYPNQEFLNKTEESKRKYPVGYIAQNVKDNNYNMSDAQYYTMVHHFAKITVPEMRVVGITFYKNDPSQFKKEEIAHSKNGTVKTYEVDYLLHPESTNKFDTNAVMILVANENGEACHIGYLAKEFVAEHPIKESTLVHGTMVDYSNGKFNNVSYRLSLDLELLDIKQEPDLMLTDEDLQGIGDLSLDKPNDRLIMYQTKFSLLNPVNDYDSAATFLDDWDMTDQFTDDANTNGINTDHIVSVNWVLENDMFGHVEILTDGECTDDDLEWMSDWVRDQHSDGLGQVFEQQSFAESCDNDDRHPTRSSFDWENDAYTFRKIELPNAHIDLELTDDDLNFAQTDSELYQ